MPFWILRCDHRVFFTFGLGVFNPVSLPLEWWLQNKVVKSVEPGPSGLRVGDGVTWAACTLTLQHCLPEGVEPGECSGWCASLGSGFAAKGIRF